MYFSFMFLTISQHFFFNAVGETTNLMQIDTQKFLDLSLYLNLVWTSPLQIVLAMYFLWQILGPSSLAGIVRFGFTKVIYHKNYKHWKRVVHFWKMKVFQIRQYIAHFDQWKPLISKMPFKLKSNGQLQRLLRFRGHFRGHRGQNFKII